MLTKSCFWPWGCGFNKWFLPCLRSHSLNHHTIHLRPIFLSFIISVVQKQNTRLFVVSPAVVSTLTASESSSGFSSSLCSSSGICGTVAGSSEESCVSPSRRSASRHLLSSSSSSVMGISFSSRNSSRSMYSRWKVSPSYGMVLSQMAGVREAETLPVPPEPPPDVPSPIEPCFSFSMSVRKITV